LAIRIPSVPQFVRSLDISSFFFVLYQPDIVLYADGIVEGSAKYGLIPWEDIESVIWNERSSTVELNIHNQLEPVTIYLEFYNINLKNFVELVQESLNRTEHPILAQHSSLS
jgi:hypothetical protein